ncbi:CRISPR-associated protein Csx11 [Chloroflexus sp. MS-CIW-1]|uniref:CRISPR-associated protein Csx11 n=1 Tax=Chloroflexus sp. MS-CIW-1 TaxID=3055768 RepID=UPI002649E7D3|nr:CRISPR-associated protein Csx11 [Chloroflexus sp. MS-CIW-1]MDN5273442.1 CRISPR-associated protein Csx11 [Chloroflexus sp. MS-CIW-1]
MSYDLNTLVTARDNLLLAEVAAWVHDMGKCADAFYQPDGVGFNANQCQGKPRVNPHKAVFSDTDLPTLRYWSCLTTNRGQCARLQEALHPTALWKTLQRHNLSLPNKAIILAGIGNENFLEILLWGRPLVSENYSGFQTILGNSLVYLAGTLGRAHAVAHLEKEDAADGGSSKEIVSPFGFTFSGVSSLDNKLVQVISQFDRPRKDFIYELYLQFRGAPGDTRRPINEVTLWDWSSIVAALYKAELARCVLTNQQRKPSDISWRLLSIRVDGLQYLLSASRIPDVLARRELLTDALNRVQTLIEETYPLGLEVYRDENGSVFVVPDIENLLDESQVAQDGGERKTLRDLIRDAFAAGTVKNDSSLAIRHERVPELYLDDKPWKGQPAPQELPPIVNHLKRDIRETTDPQWLETLWRGQNAEVCTVCGLRPQGPSPKARERKVCDVCEQRRADRAQQWARALGCGDHPTIWIDDLTDIHGRYALIVGAFDLSGWLAGDLVRTLVVRQPGNSNRVADKVSKNPSFARLRRIWETTRAFWQQVAPVEPGGLSDSLIGRVVGRAGPRLEIQGRLNSQALTPYHTYELVLHGGIRLSVLWDGKCFITCDNLDYLNSLMRLKKVQDILKQGETFLIEASDDTGKRHQLDSITLSQDAVPIADSSFVPALPLLAEPRVFMALVPADKALEIIRQIKTKYEREMGKVRNRLPLHLGVVFAPRPTPLRAVLDAGRAMLERQTVAGVWEVLCCARKMVSQGDSLPPRFQPDQAGQFAEWYEVTLQRDDQRLTWHIPALMGDGQTEDLWYPYVFLDDPTEPTTRKRYFKSRNPWKGCDGWLVHADELQVGDRVWFTPATFDFEFLDTTTRRFEIHYDTNGRRTNRRTRPFYIDDLERFDRLWEVFLCLSTTQRHQVVRTIEVTREEWFARDRNGTSVTDPVFKQFVHDTLAGAGWDWKALPQHIRDQFVAAGVRGELADLLELRMEILKEE